MSNVDVEKQMLILKVSALERFMTDVCKVEFPDILEAISGALGFKVLEVPGTDTNAAMVDMYNYLKRKLHT